MLLRLIVFFVAIPFVELVLLLGIADLTSWWFTVMLILATALLGMTLARRQGLRTWRRIREQLALGQSPTHEVLDGLLILLAGLLLIAPGPLTDTAGLLLLIPAVRASARLRMGDWFRQSVSVRVQSFGSPPPPPHTNGPTIIDAEFTRHPVERAPDRLGNG